MKRLKEFINYKLKEYINNNYISEQHFLVAHSRMERRPLMEKAASLNKFKVDEPFNTKLFKLIDESGKSDVEIYKKAGIDRRHFSKIKSSSDYVPQKRTIIAFIIALELPLEEAEPLLESAGYSLSPSYLFDVIVEFFIRERIYDVIIINESLLEHDQPLIGY